jgi:O-antigen biosynthesis protein
MVAEAISRAARSLLDRVLGASTATDLVLDEAPLPSGFEGLAHISSGATRLLLSESIRPGWYMLELRVEFDGVRADARVYLEGSNGDRALLPLPMRSGQLVKRLVFVETPAVLRLLPLAAPRAFEVLHFRLARVPERFARSRIERKLSARHPRYMPQVAHATSAAMQPRMLRRLDTRSLWADYNRLYERCAELVSYDEWIDAVERRDCPAPREQTATIRSWPEQPTFSLVVRTDDNVDEAALIECLNSVLEQTYSRLELCIADDSSTAPHVRRIVSDYAARDPRARVVFGNEGRNPTESINAALALARGDYVGFLGSQDVLARHALFSLARALQGRPGAQLVYSDEDKLDELGRRCEPYFKPDFARDLLYSQNYVAHLTVYRRKLVEAGGGLRPGFDGSDDYDLLLRCVAEIGDESEILHVPEVLYHSRKAADASATKHREDEATESARRALSHHLESVSPGVQVSVTAPGLYRAHWPVPSPAPLVSLIVPTRDRHELLAKCIDSIHERTTYTNYEIVVVDNQSQAPEALAYLASLAREERVRVLRYDAPFNYSAINNFAVREARGSVLGLINNDVEVINGDWLTELVSHALRPDIGCVGAKLYYPDDTIQHAGVVLGIGGVAGHSHKHFDRAHPGYFGRLRIAHNVAAVTAATLVVRRAIWDEVGGLNEAELSVAFNDVDFCLRVRAKGYRNVWTPHAELYHDESRSRGSDEASEKAARFRNECEAMLRHWGALLKRDPYYSPHLTLIREDYSLSLLGAPAVPSRGAV